MFRKVQESQTLLINTETKRLIANKEKVTKFGFGQSPFLPPKKVMKTLSLSAHRKEYSSIQGDPVLRQRISQFHNDHNGLEIAAENIIVAPGSKILLFNILLAFEKADVYIPAPSWVSYAPQVKLAGHNIIYLPTSYEERWRISSKTMKAATKQKKHETTIIILNYPGNPDGLSYNEAELQDLAEEARAQEMLVISDEIYGLLDHNNNHKSFALYYPERTITTTGLSKWCGAGGWRFGAALLYNNIEPEFRKALIGIGSETYSCAPMPVQAAASTAYSSYNGIKEYLDNQLSILKTIGNYCAEKLNAANIRVHPPDGGFYLFADFSPHKKRLSACGVTTSAQLCNRLLSETSVALLPASAFGFSEELLAVRLAYVDFQPPEVNEVFTMDSHGAMVVAGIESIINWIDQELR